MNRKPTRNRLARWAIALVALAAMSGCVVYPYGRARVYYEADVYHHPHPIPR